VAVAALLFLTQQTISGRLYALNRYPFRFGYAESAAVFPIGTTRTSFDGPLFNAIEHGGYLELHGKTPFIDGRLEVMDEDFFLAYLRALEGDGWDALEQRWHPTVALVPANDRELVRRLLGDRSWALVDVDAVSFLFAREMPEHAKAIEASQERLRDLDTPSASAGDAIAPPPPPGWFSRIFGRRNVAFAAFGRGANFLQLGMYEAARRDLREALLNTDQPEPALLKSYVIATARVGRVEEARAWCSRLVDVAPQDEDARVLLASLKPSGS
jgi:tetratricopeptide (TPR) repeat protein